MCENDVDLQSDKLVCDLRVALVASFSPAHIDCNVATFDPTEFAQALHKSSGMLALGRRCRRAQEANRWELRCLLRARRERPRGRRAAEERDEFAPSHSITSSARASSVGGTSRLIALAVLRLTTSSNLVGCSTGRSPGFAPRAILST